ncbi:hypothetical protein LTR78_002171 [Recurvomyces mirabilis]|uniref:Spindle pole body component n=1 Tax=Recurvomyces mirabilis TaxID=574656 RepID=A0AAE1C4Q3_9PEZI|nr:hypothetical protein LTR78_002171 [Recurvomyces mirabilis]KAK5160628.1 hypothetical protein LTS14_001640 [Recurvomyces mirabilis]
MLHEVLLALSGHPSPLFDKGGRHDNPDLHSLLSPSEAALLKGIGRLAEHHRQLRRHAKWIASKHRSTICRAVATCIQETHLARFQKKILAVESKILTKDPTIVGAYDIVPLASVAAEFDDWHRLMQWLWDITCSMQPDGSDDVAAGCTGAALINRLRNETNTGFPEIGQTAIGLSTVAEVAWLRQLSPWLVYGKLPIHSTVDFFVKLEATSNGGQPAFTKDKDLLPCFVSPATASSILFVGKSVRQAGSAVPQGPNLYRGNIDQQLAATHLEKLSSLPLPINPAQLSRAVSAHLLPMGDITCLLTCLRRYFLLGHGEFATVLIDEAERLVTGRQQGTSRLLQQDPVKGLQSLSIKDPELNQTLTSTWKVLARDDELGSDDTLDFARKHTTLETPKTDFKRPTSADGVRNYSQTISPVEFGDLLFPTTTMLHLDAGPPLDLLVSTQDVRNYAKFHSYILGIRRAQYKLANLWRRTSSRRGDTGKRKPSSGLSTKHDMRKIWATSSAALFLVSETAAYFEGDIVRESCDHFEQWVKHPVAGEDTELSASSVHSKATEVAQRDPETLAAAHRAFLAALTYALLLTDSQYTRELRSLLGNIDALIAFFNRFLDIQQKADVGSESSYTTAEQQKMALELDRARKKVDSDSRSVVNRLRQLDRDRLGSQRYLHVPVQESGGFEPWKGGGVDRLLMKLEFGRMRDEEMGWDVV